MSRNAHCFSSYYGTRLEPDSPSFGGSTIECSVLDFCTLALKSDNAAMRNLAKTLIVYNANAHAYFG